MREKSCANCIFSGGEDVKAKGKYWSSCRVEGPLMSSDCVSPKDNAWAGYWPWIAWDDWCGRFANGNIRIAKTIELGPAEPIIKPSE